MPKTFNTASEAEAWLRTNPMREIRCNGPNYRYNPNKGCIEAFNKKQNMWEKSTTFLIPPSAMFINKAPYTVVEEKTITINGEQYREGDVLLKDECFLAPDGVTLKKFPHFDTGMTCWDITHIPDELADKSDEPKTLTLEEVDGDREIFVITPTTKQIDYYTGCTIGGFYALKAHVDAGHKLYASREDAERGKALGWS